MQLTIETDTAALLQALDRLGDEADRLLSAVSRQVADDIKDEAQSRLRRQTSGTGQTADAITVVKADAGGWLVTSGDMGARPANLPIWLEFGTKHMERRPYLLAAAQLEEGSFYRRVEETLQAAIDGVALGEAA